MSSTRPLPLSRACLIRLLLVSVLLLPPVLLPRSATGTDPVCQATGYSPAATLVSAPLDPEVLPMFGSKQFSAPSSHLSGASLLFVIWLVAEQISADHGEQAEADGLDQAPADKP